MGWTRALDSAPEEVHRVTLEVRAGSNGSWMDTGVTHTLETFSVLDKSGAEVICYRDTLTREHWTSAELAESLWHEAWLYYVHHREESENTVMRIGGAIRICDAEGEPRDRPTCDIYPEVDRSGNPTGRALIADLGDDEQGTGRGGFTGMAERREFMRERKEWRAMVMESQRAQSEQSKSMAEAFAMMRDNQTAYLEDRDRVHRMEMIARERDLNEREDDIANEAFWNRFDTMLAPLLPMFLGAFASKFGVDVPPAPASSAPSSSPGRPESTDTLRISREILALVDATTWSSLIELAPELMADVRTALEGEADNDESAQVARLRACLDPLFAADPAVMQQCGLLLGIPVIQKLEELRREVYRPPS